MSPASGAATRPPYPAFSTTTAKAMRGDSAGAKPTNHECDGAPWTSAVPVFPAIATGCEASTWPVPEVTASRMAPRRNAASGGRSQGTLVAAIFAPGCTMAASWMLPLLAMAATARAMRSGLASTSP